MRQPLSRRCFLGTSLGTVGLALGNVCRTTVEAADVRPRDKLPIAAVVTVYHHNSHADVIVGKVLEGWLQDGGPGPDLKLVSIYVDQVGDHDLSVPLARKHGFRLAKSIPEALTLGTNSLAVAGVLSIGEHGNYPSVPETQQTMYPRRRFFDEIAATFKMCGKVAPVFNDKHLSYAWSDAKHMFDTARDMRIPFMAGSSVPVMWRSPSVTFPIGTEISEAIALGSGGLDHHGIHTLEGLQCLVERRKGGETGVKSVQAVQGDGIWQAEKSGRWSKALFDAVVEASPKPYAGKVARPPAMSKDAVFYLIEYRDGLKATVAMNTGLTHEFACGVSIRGQEKPFAVTFLPQDFRPFGHFEQLLRAVEHMFHTGHPAYPVDRTLLTTGILDTALHSLVEKSSRLETPYLDVTYSPVDWPFPKGMPPLPPA
ncbi:MAG: hypothetical protein JWM11_179 [Planctomycetaceae bacterium]|nr:hypothetical protein [Planctomycetaceae bacterium]